MAVHEHRFELSADDTRSETRLERVAAGALRNERVRSVTVDRARAIAIVRTKRCEAAIDLDDALAYGPAGERTDGNDAQLPAVISWIDPRDSTISFVRLPKRASGWRKALYLLLAAVFLGLGLIGVALPGLPTTPFVLLGSYFLLRSSQRLHERLMTSRLFGGILRDWHVHRGIRPHVRARAIGVVAIVVGVSLAVARPPLPILISIVSLAACGLLVIWRLPGIMPSES
jgi:uncharacterized membrane protein YbaN (DUF454 family)